MHNDFRKMVQVMISTLTRKQYQLLKYLMKPGGFLSAEELGKRLDLSARTVIRYVNTLNSELEEYGIRILLKRGQGYYLEGPPGELKALLADRKSVV